MLLKKNFKSKIYELHILLYGFDIHELLSILPYISFKMLNVSILSVKYRRNLFKVVIVIERDLEEIFV